MYSSPLFPLVFARLRRRAFLLILPCVQPLPMQASVLGWLPPPPTEPLALTCHARQLTAILHQIRENRVGQEQAAMC